MVDWRSHWFEARSRQGRRTTLPTHQTTTPPGRSCNICDVLSPYRIGQQSSRPQSSQEFQVVHQISHPTTRGLMCRSIGANPAGLLRSQGKGRSEVMLGPTAPRTGCRSRRLEGCDWGGLTPIIPDLQKKFQNICKALAGAVVLWAVLPNHTVVRSVVLPPAVICG